MRLLPGNKKRAALPDGILVLLDHVDRGDIVGWNDLILQKRLFDLSGLRLHGGCLRGISFAGTKLEGAEFIDCDLQRADFTDAELSDANFIKSRLRGAKFVGSRATRARFDRV